MNVELLEYMGSDLSVVNSARVSMSKTSAWDQIKDADGTIKNVLNNKDARLLRYLAENNHHTPFCHATVTFRIECSIAVCRQLAKSQVGGTINEVSRRYVDSTPTLDVPTQWRKRAPNVKQGSADELVRIDSSMEAQINNTMDAVVRLYEDLLLMGVCPEQARFVLPLCMNTEFYWTGTLLFFARVCNLRLDPHAQKETRDVAERISLIMDELFPESWNVLMEKKYAS
jgi:thymidylate synthase (FAD)